MARGIARNGIDATQVTELLLKMLRIPGVSTREGKIIDFIRGQLRRAGAPAAALCTDTAHKLSPLGGESGNLIMKLPGTVPGPRRMLMAHTDTVPLCEGSRPVQRNGFLRSADPERGIGADNRSGCAAILVAALEILRRRLPHPPLTFVWTIQEEVGLYGARYLDKALLGNPKLCFNWDGGPPALMRMGATGAYRLHIDVTGLASHAGSAPEAGISATAIAGLAIASLQKDGWHGLVLKNGKRGTSNIGVLRGGSATNVVTASLHMDAEVRSHERQFRDRIVAAFRQAFERAARQVRNAAGKRGRVRIRCEPKYEAFRLRESEPAAVEARRCIAALGLTPTQHISNGGLDANWLYARGLPTVTLGAGQRNPHTVKECLHLQSFVEGCAVALALACGK